MALSFSASVFVGYGCLYFLGAVIATIYSYIDSRAEYTAKTSLKKRIILFFRSLYSKKKMYVY